MRKTHIHYLFIIFLLIISTDSFSQRFASDSLIRPYREYNSGDKDFDLILAAEAGDTKMVSSLLNRGADVNTTTLDGVTPLMYAAEKGYFDVSRILILNGAEINRQPEIGPPAIIGAVKAGQLPLTELLINNGADISIKDDKGAQSIHYAAAYLFNDILDLLLFYRANPNAADKNKSTPLMAAVWANNEEGVDILIKAGAATDTRDLLGYSNIHLAAQNGNMYLLDKFAELHPQLIDKPNKQSWTPLASAVTFQHLPAVEFLTENGADVNHSLTVAANPLEVALVTKNDSIISFLKEKGAKRKWQPAFRKMSIGFNTRLNQDDFFIGADLGLLETKYNFSLHGGFIARPYKSRVRIESGGTTFQLWERRFMFYFGADKYFLLKKGRKKNLGAFIGLRANYSFGKYFGTLMDLESGAKFEPRAGFYARGKHGFYYINYSYLNFNLEEHSPHFLEIGAAFSFRLGRETNKQFNWY